MLNRSLRTVLLFIVIHIFFLLESRHLGVLCNESTYHHGRLRGLGLPVQTINMLLSGTDARLWFDIQIQTSHFRLYYCTLAAASPSTAVNYHGTGGAVRSTTPKRDNYLLPGSRAYPLQQTIVGRLII